MTQTMTQTAIGLFDDRNEAQRAVDELLGNGFSRSEVTLTSSTSSPAAVDVLTGANVPQQDANFYAEGVRRGGSLVIVRTEAGRAQNAADIMRRFNMVDVDARLAEYASAGTSNIGLSQLDSEGRVLPVIEEQLQVGKRQVQTGGIRIHTFVSERPVEEQVTLRDETVHVERRPVDRNVSNADLDAFRDRTIEMTETHEEAVVSKQARVIEEVVIGKNVEEHTETVRDTVRRTDVEVEQLTGGRTMSVGSDVNDADFRSYYNSNLASSGYSYEEYSPVFRYGSSLSTNDRYRGRDWASIEADARRDWEARNPGSWDQFKDSVRYAWERATSKR